MRCCWPLAESFFGVSAQRPVALLVDDYASRIEAAMADDRLNLLRAAFYPHGHAGAYLDNINSTAPDSELGRAGAPAERKSGAQLLELYTLGVGGAISRRMSKPRHGWISGVSAPDLGTADALADGGFAWIHAGVAKARCRCWGKHTHWLTVARQWMRSLHRLALHRPRHGMSAASWHNALSAIRRLRRWSSAWHRPMCKAAGDCRLPLWVMLASPAFADSLLKQRMFRLPQDYVLATARGVSGRPITHAEPLLNMLQAMGQAPFLRLTPDGYPQNAGEWQTALGMALRVQLAQALAQRQWRLTGPADAAQACNWDAAAAERSAWGHGRRQPRGRQRKVLPPAQQAICCCPPRHAVALMPLRALADVLWFTHPGPTCGPDRYARRWPWTGQWRSVVAGGEHARIEHQLQAVFVPMP